MINTSKLLPRRSNKSNLSSESIKNLGIVSKGLTEVDGLLKERLVFSKLRDGILKQQDERRRRFQRETNLERKGKDSDYDIGNPLQTPRRPKPGTGGLIGGIASTATRLLGLAAFSRVGSLLKVGKTLGLLLNPKVLVIGSTIAILSKIITSTDDGIFKKVSKQDAEKLRGGNVDNTINKFIEGIQFLSGALLGAATIAFVRQRIANRQAIGDFANERSMLYSRGDSVRGKARADAEADMAADKAKARAREASKQRKIDKKIFAKTDAQRDIEETNIRQSRAQRNISKQVGGQIVPQTSRTTTAVMDRGRGMSGIMKRNSFLIDPTDFDVRSKLTKDGIENFFLGDSNIRLSEIDVDGQTLFEAEKTPNLRRKIAKQYGIKPNDFDFNNTFDTFELRSNIGVKARRDAGIDALLDEMNMTGARDFTSRQRAEMSDTLSKIIDRNFNDNKFAQRTERSRQRAAADPLSKMGTGSTGSKVVSRGRVGSRQFLRPDGSSTDAAYRSAMKTKKVTAEALTGVGQKGMRKFISESVGVIPFIGDLIGMLIDIFVFGEPPGRAAFMAVGGALGGIIGGILGSAGGPLGAMGLGIVGSIGGDFLGGALYDLFFRSGETQNPFSRIPKSGIKSIVKQAGLMTGGFADYGMYKLGEAGREFVLDADSTAAIERKVPGLLMSLNKADADGAINILRDYAFYESGAGSEKIIPLPFPIMPESSSNKGQKTIVLSQGSGGGNRTLSQHYRRG